MIQFETNKQLKAKEKLLYAPIKKVLLADILPKHSFPPGNEYAIIAARKHILNFCSEVYSPTPNIEIFPQVEAGLKFAGLEFKKRITIIGNSKFYVDYIIMERMKTLSVNDIFPKISIWNSYDGVVKFRKEFGFYKLLCSNGLSRPTEKISTVSFKHTKHNVVNISDEIATITKNFLKDSKNDMRVFDKMNRQDADTKVIKTLSKKLALGPHVVEAAENRFKLETTGKIPYLNEHNETVTSTPLPKSMFTVYNALNWAISNCNPKELPEKKLEKDRQLLELVEAFA